MTSIPFFAQKKYQCGPAALAMVLQWTGVNIQPDELVSMVYTPGRKGSLQSSMVTAARRHGKLAYPLTGMNCLIQATASGRPVIVLQNLGLKWFPRWHYAVVVGYDLQRRIIFLHTGENAFREVGFKVFVNTWKRSGHWALQVMPVDQMPDCPDKTTYLNAALGLQLAGQSKASISAFKNAVFHWPYSIDAHIALGNAYYQYGETQNAIASFSQAVEIEPQNGDALNNLAHLLSEAGELERAEKIASKAVGTGGPHLDIYKQTLSEIQRKRQ